MMCLRITNAKCLPVWTFWHLATLCYPSKIMSFDVPVNWSLMFVKIILKRWWWGRLKWIVYFVTNTWKSLFSCFNHSVTILNRGLKSWRFQLVGLDCPLNASLSFYSSGSISIPLSHSYITFGVLARESNSQKQFYNFVVIDAEITNHSFK